MTTRFISTIRNIGIEKGEYFITNGSPSPIHKAVVTDKYGLFVRRFEYDDEVYCILDQIVEIAEKCEWGADD